MVLPVLTPLVLKRYWPCLESKKCQKSRVGLTSEAQYVSGTPFLNQLCSKRKEQVKGRSKPAKKSSKLCSPKVSYRKRTAAARLREKMCKKPQRVLTNESEEENQDSFCGVCSVLYGTEDKLWIQCNCCDSWFHTECVNDHLFLYFCFITPYCVS